MALLACLALRDEATSTRPRLAALLWHDRAPEQANGSLRQELLRLRRAFDGGITLPAAKPPAPVPRLAEDAVEVDVLRFEQVAAEPARASEATVLYRGPLLQGFVTTSGDPFATWLGHHRARLQALAAATLLRVVRGPEASEAAAQRLLELDPVCEEAWRFLIRSHAGRGDLGRAQAAFRGCVAALQRHGQPPSQETRSLMGIVEAELSASTASMFGIMHGPRGDRTDWVKALRQGPKSLQAPEPSCSPWWRGGPPSPCCPSPTSPAMPGCWAIPSPTG